MAPDAAASGTGGLWGWVTQTYTAARTLIKALGPSSRVDVLPEVTWYVCTVDLALADHFPLCWSAM
jgi:hypothetical protein